MDETGPVNVHALYTFRGVEYAVSVSTDEEKLSVQVEQEDNGDQWRSEFDVNYIEDLTHKTGNFKQFNIFVNMLETALNKSSDAVSLDLLTYADLESLRNRRHGSRPASTAGSKSTALNTKRYIILTYTVEFDRIHYPLPLAYQGKPDPRTLQETVRQLRSEISLLKSQSLCPTQTPTNEEYDKLKSDYAMLIEERDQIEDEFEQYRRDCKPTSKTAKELKTLRAMIKHLEEELTKERSKYKKLTAKKASEYKQLMDELDETRSAERNLRLRVKCLTNELGFYKRNRVHSPVGRQSAERKPQWSVSQSAERKPIWARQSRGRTSSREREVRSSSRDRCRTERSPSLRESQSQERLRRIRSSQERLRASQERVRVSQERRSQERRLAPLRSRSPSPANYSGHRDQPRFDPTAYIREKRRREQEAGLRSSREIRSSQNGSTVEGGQRRSSRSPGYVNSVRRSSGGRRYFPRSGSVESLGSQSGDENSSVSRLRRFQRIAKSQEPPSKRREFQSMPPRPNSSSGKKIRFTPEPAVRRQTKDNVENIEPRGAQPKDYLATTDEISEIDARLKRLQQYMANNMVIKT